MFEEVSGVSLTLFGSFVVPMVIYNPSQIEKFPNKTSFIKSGGYNSYLSKSSKIDHKVKIGRNCLIDRNVVIASDSVIKNSIIGANVQIGEGVKIIDSLVLEDTVIEDGVNLLQSFVGKSVKIGVKSMIKTSEIGTQPP